MRLALLLALPFLAACPAKKEEKRESAPEPERPIPVPRSTTPVPIHSLLADARSKAGPGQVPVRIGIDYVRADGLIDPAFGEVDVSFGTTQREPQDDPQRPTGAPVKPMPKRPAVHCQPLSWKENVWSSRQGPCGRTSSETVTEMQCTVPIIWERAIAMGAPRDAVARLSFTAGENARWTFKIEDTVRDVRFSSAFADDCGLVAEAPDPTVGPDSVPDSIDRTIIKNTIGTVKAGVSACGQRIDAKGIVKVSVKVNPDGSSAVRIRETPKPELGDCVKAVIERGKFPATHQGGSFSYPFVF